MNYLEALKIYNKGQNSWCSPRKGTPEYYMVKAIMNKNSSKSLSSIKKSSKSSSQVMSKNIAMVKPSSSSIEVPKKRILPNRRAKQMPIHSTSSSSSIEVPKKRILPNRRAKQMPKHSTSSSSSTIII